MGKSLAVGVFKGLAVGLVVALVAIKWLGSALLIGALGYLLAAATGLVVGLIAGQPVWARDAKIEASLKAVVGALAAAGVLFVLRRWIQTVVDLNSLGLGSGKLSELAVVTLPIIAVPLALLFEADDAVGGAAKSRAAAQPKLRAPAEPETQDDEEELESPEQRTSQRTKR